MLVLNNIGQELDKAVSMLPLDKVIEILIENTIEINCENLLFQEPPLGLL